MLDQSWYINDEKFAYTRRYRLRVVEDSVDPITNTSTLTWTFSMSGFDPAGGTTRYGIGPITIKIGGTTVYTLASSVVNNSFPCVPGSRTGTLTIDHNADGTKSIKVEWHLESATPITTYDEGGTVALTPVDRTAPTVSISVTDVTETSFNMTITSSAEANLFGYSLDDGATWTSVSGSGTSKSFTVSGLANRTTFNIKGRARKTLNEIYGVSAVVSITTKGYTLLNSVENTAIDGDAPQIVMNWSIYDAEYTHTLDIKDGSTTLLTITGLTGPLGTGNKTIALTSAQRSTLLSAMSTVQTLSVTYTLTTYRGSTLIGAATPVTAMLTTSSANSAPIFTDFSYADTNAATIAVTGSATVIVQNQSILGVSYTAATAQNGATIVNYHAVLGTKSADSTTTSLSLGTIPTAGTQQLRLTVTDSRGYTTTVKKSVKVTAYQNIVINDYESHRINNVDSLITLSFSGTFSPVIVGSTAKNSFSLAKYRYKRVTDSSWSAYTTISGVAATTVSFTYSSLGFTNLDPEYEYNVEIYVADQLTSSTLVIFIPKGKPLVAFRSEKVGINTNNPQTALDVDGNISMNGQQVQGFVRALTSIDDLNDIKAAGIYYAGIANSTGLNYPSSYVGILEVIVVNTAFIMQRYTTIVGTIYQRIFTTYWDFWNNLDGSVAELYEGVDLTVKFAPEINGNPWAWIQSRIQAGNYEGIKINDYIPFVANTKTYKACVAGINTYTNYGDTGHITPNHIDFISRELWPTLRRYNPVNFNNGTAFEGETAINYPWLASELYLYMNSLAGKVCSAAEIGGGTPIDVDFTADGIYYYLPAELKAVIVQKRIYMAQRSSATSVRTSDASGGWTDIGNLWLPTEWEVHGGAVFGLYYSVTTRGTMVRYPLFNAVGNRAKKTGNTRAGWWLITPRTGASTSFCYVTTGGDGSYANASAASTARVPICFRIA